MKRLLFLVHRWSGVALALFMTLWVFSGLVILYSVQLNQNRIQQLAHAELLQPEAGWLSFGEAWERSAAQRKQAVANKKAANPGAASAEAVAAAPKPVENTISEARLVRRAGVPQWLAEDSSGRRFAISAQDGSLLETSAASAIKIADNWVNGDNPGQATPLRFIETVDKPMIVRNQDALRPFHRFAADDGLGTELYVSARSGDVVQVSTRIERGLYWVGNWLHFFRFLDLTGFGESRAEILMWTVIVAFVACLTGLIVGWLRWRPGYFGKATYSQGRVHPYREVWLRWHFWAGLIGGVFALAWALSGFFNGNTWKLFTPATPSQAEMARYYGPGIPTAMRAWKPLPLGNESLEVAELSWRRLGDQAVLLAYGRDGQRQPLSADLPIFQNKALNDAAQRLVGDKYNATQRLQTEYDSYYYPRHGRGTYDRPLPVMRIELDDAAATYVYLDPQDGRLLLRQDSSRRAYRWLFNALHYWDIGWLHVRPVWDVWMLVWIGFGLVLSVSSVVLGWRRLKTTFRPRKRAALEGTAPPVLVTDTQGI